MEGNENDLTNDEVHTGLYHESDHYEKWQVDEPLFLNNMTFVPPATSVDPELYLESDEDVRLYEDVSGSFRGFWRYYGSEKIFALVDLDDGRKVHVWTYYFRRFGREIFKIKEGERISLHKMQDKLSSV